MTGAPVADRRPAETALGEPSGVPSTPGRDGDHLAEVWGDVVDLRHLAQAIAVGACVSLAAYLLAGRLLSTVVAAQDVARSYAMLAGLLGCVAGGAICAGLFRPKRIVTELGAMPMDLDGDETSLDGSWSAEAQATLPASVLAEMRELGLGGGPRKDAA